MNHDHALRRLNGWCDRPEPDLIEHILAHRDQFTEPLLHILEQVLPDEDHPHRMRTRALEVDYALTILGFWREPRAWPVLRRILETLDDEQLEATFCDMRYELLPQVIMAVVGERGAEVEALVLGEQTGAEARTVATQALVGLAVFNEWPRHNVIQVFRRLLSPNSRLTSEDDQAFLACYGLDLGPVELEHEYRTLFARDRIDPVNFSIEEFEESLALGPEQACAQARDAANEYRRLKHPLAELTVWYRPPPPIEITDATQALALMRRTDGHFAYDAVRWADAHRAECVPLLIKLLQELSDRPGRFLDDPDFVAHRYAVTLLGAWREPTALVPMAGFVASLTGDQLDHAFHDDFLLEEFDAHLARVAHGDTGPLVTLAASSSIYEWTRYALFHAMKYMVLLGQRDRDEVLRELAHIADDLLDPDDEVGRQALAYTAYQLHPGPLADTIRKWFDDDKIDEDMFDRQSFEKRCAEDPAAVLTTMRTNELCRIEACDDVIACFAFYDWDTDAKRKADQQAAAALARRQQGRSPQRPADKFDHDFTNQYTPGPDPIRAAPTTGRNDPCPCGSGKKFKKCCGK